MIILGGGRFTQVYKNQPNFRSTKIGARNYDFTVADLQGITHIQVNPKTHQLKLCDFGSAKMLESGKPNISYICSRYYRLCLLSSLICIHSLR
ncbi:hypothetical protein L1987_07320 [Smallanthus sonchifolius]|uniref:Uncharacterized protein n=1 Tax=Smallanthus sonchifolius TaxID=185202 RepID=A0ACB9K0F6_9ASTR|nr:hypothetical protein L1987_07320 [Smallanthus sonchifolius]